jgi:hypothetical protein
LQLEYIDSRPTPDAIPQAVSRKPLQVIDHRSDAHPLAALQQLADSGSWQVYAEAEAVKKLAEAGIIACTRLDLQTGIGLAIWTPPPGPAELRAILEKSRPETVALFAVLPEALDQAGFLRRLAGLVKFALNRGQFELGLEKLAALTAQRSSAVRTGLAWLEGQGVCRAMELPDGSIQIQPGDPAASASDPRDSEALAGEVRELLQESAAFREYYRRASPQLFISQHLPNGEASGIPGRQNTGKDR